MAAHDGRASGGDRGQVLPLMVLGLLGLALGMAAFVVDVGHAYWVRHQLQGATDAAALAAAQDLPDVGAAKKAAEKYGASAKNEIRGADDATTRVVKTRCLDDVSGCAIDNAIVIESTAHVTTSFARVFGVDSFDVHARATACSPCGTRPLDVMFVVDRTGSMCQFHDGRNDAACTDLANARAGMRTFLTLMDPEQDHVGLAVLPPAPDVAGRCESPGSYDDDLAYVVVPLSSDYLTGGALDEQSDLVSTIRCVKGGGSTSYAAALALAQRELEQHGRPEVQKVIVFLSDGAANTTPDWYPRDLQLADAPCHQGIAIASWIKARGTLVYSIGYDVNPRDDGHERCLDPSSGADEKPTITAYEALRQIASDGDFYLGNDLTASQMRRIFSNVAADMLRGSSKLVADED